MNFKVILAVVVAAVVGVFAYSSVSKAADFVQAEGLPGVMIPAPVKKNYVGVNTGVRIDSGSQNSVGFVAGRQLNDNVAVEGSIERTFNGGNDTTRAGANVLLGTHVGPVNPYVLGGVGYEWRDSTTDRAVFVLGAGAKVALTEELDLDARYRYIDAFDSAKRDEDHVIGLGLNVKF